MDATELELRRSINRLSERIGSIEETIISNISESVVELAETTKELVRILKCHDDIVLQKFGEQLDKRLDDVYKKATRAKDRIGA